MLGLEPWWLVPCAVLLDMLWADPQLPWRHPVCYLGAVYNFLEPIARKLGGGRSVGIACVALTSICTGLIVYGFIHLPVVGPVFALYFAWAGLCAEGLIRTGIQVNRVVAHGSLVQAQQAMAMLVSRDTHVQNRQQLAKSLAETLSENHTDAIIAPLFWLLAGGPVGLWMYKAVSTADSMWGYMTPQWRDLGCGGAKLDDILAYIPARIGIVFLWLADLCTHTSQHFAGQWPGWQCICRQAKKLRSPNSGWSMSAAAWLLGARVGGPTQYFGHMVQKPWLGDMQKDWRSWTPLRLAALCRLLRVAAICATVGLYGCAWLVTFFVL